MLLVSGPRVTGICHVDIYGKEGILGIAILESFQGRGLAKVPLRYAIKLAKELGLERIRSVDIDNYRAISLYKTLGFNIIRRINNCSRSFRNSFVDCYEMEIKLL
ncbi:GNAT family N-acetyltransferase [Infirmifilum sp. NZ]|uniref:GNAT family N-acetyltransferase n=1 Tax=Infirmifilum sp. NZ TaxID=2926850 RepID=UPI003FA3899A